MKLFFYSFAIFLFISCKAQTGKIYPEGITVDPEIEKICNQKKDSLNSFFVTYYVNDAVYTNPLSKSFGQFPLTPLVQFTATDTVINFMNMLSTTGIAITFSKTGCKVQYYQASRSCLCFKNSLSQDSLSYQASAIPDKMVLVLSNKDNFKKNNVLYGYIETHGGGYYAKQGDNNFDKRSAAYRGYFKVNMKEMEFMK